MAPTDKRKVCLLGIVLALKAKIKQKKKKKLWANQFLLAREEHYNGSMSDELRLEPADLFGYLKIDQTTYYELLAMITPLIERADTSMRKAITAHERLYATLLFLATGRTYMDLQYSTRISTQSLGSLIPETCKAICKVLAKDYMKYPSTEEEWTAISEEFEKKWHFPNCLGYVDAKHARISPPPAKGTNYVNYSGYTSLVLFGVVNANYEFIFFDVDSNDRTFDGNVLENSSFGQSLITNDLPLPKEKALDNSDRPLPYVFIGDEAFSLRENLLTSFPSHVSNYDQLIYNYRLARVRSIGENTFGILCERFRLFHTSVNTSLPRVEQAFRTCGMLHNFLTKKCPQHYVPEDSLYSEDTVKCEINPGIIPEPNTLIELKRGECVDGSEEAKQVQYSFINHFCNDGALDWQCNMVLKNNLLRDHFLFNQKE